MCEVALGTCNQLQRPNQDADNLPKGKHSTHACGRQQPDPKDTTKVFKDVTVPYGKIVSATGGMGANEFIVYRTDQIRMRYLVRIKAV